MKILILLISIYSATTYSSGFFEENNLTIPISKTKASQDIRQLYQNEIDLFIKHYNDPDLKIDFEWENPKVNAFASRVGKVKKVRILGGLARHKSMNLVIFQTILCHELGHHYGGSPYKTGKSLSVEGKSDYYALNTCIKNYIELSNNETFLKDYKVSRAIKKICPKEDFKCQRLYISSLLTAKFARTLRQTSRGNRFAIPKIEKKDNHIVSKTLESHPAPQCRLDTFIQGSKDLIDTEDSYPRCWFAP